jgi:uncharacterized integral membrane protein (TIGR00697 family)
MQDAFSGIFGQGMRIIIGSITAFLVSQLVDSYVFHKIKRATGEKRIWLRATGSTLVSQLIDSYIVLFIAFGGVFSWQQILAIGVVNYLFIRQVWQLSLHLLSLLLKKELKSM